MSRTTTSGGERGAPVSAGALDAPAWRGLARQRKRGWLLVLAGVAIVAPVAALWVWNQRFHGTGTRVDATVVDVDTGWFDRVTVAYRLDGRRYRSEVHLDDAKKYCLPRDEFDVDYSCDAEPVVVVDPNDPGHATLPGEVNLSPAAMALFKVSLVSLACIFPLIMLGFGITELVRARRHRRVLTQHMWVVHQSRARSPRTFEVSLDGQRWRSLTIKGGASGSRLLLRREERVEIVTFGEGRALVRAPGSDALLTGVLGIAGRSASDSVAQTAGVRSAPTSGSNLRSARAFVLVGAFLEYDILDHDGYQLGSITMKKTTWRVVCSVRDRAGRQALTLRNTFGRWSALDAQGGEVARGRRWPGASVIDLEGAAPAVQARRTYQQFEERVTLPTGQRAPRSGNCWKLLGPEDDEIARVTTVGSNFAVEMGVDVDPANAFVVLAQTLLVAVIVAKKPSSGGG
jgi:hypothetical protein